MIHLIKKNRGQAMLLSIMVIGGILIGISAIAGILLTYQIKQTGDVVNSTKAFFAADAGTEQQIYNMNSAVPNPTFSNGATVTSTILISAQDVTVQAQGFSGGAVRALETIFSSAGVTTAPVPSISNFSLSGNVNLSPNPCTDTCSFHTANPDTSVPLVPPSPVTISWSTANTTACTGSSNPNIWSDTTLSGSTTVDLSGQTPPFQFSLSCTGDGSATVYHTINLYLTNK